MPHQKSDILLEQNGEAFVLATHPVLCLKISLLTALKLLPRGARTSALLFLFCSATAVSLAQSVDINSPSPVQTNEVVGTIAARDLGDSRLTDHFYAFTGTPGDVLITVRSNNLNGDVDVFTAGSLRPLMKFTLHAESSSPVTRAVFLRKREDLILRVEARSPNDDEGIYTVRFGGSFQAIAGDAPLADAQNPTSESETTAGSRRVSSVGARIAEPPVVREEVVAAPTPDDLAAPTPTPESTIATAEAEPAPSPRRARGRVPPGRRRPASQPATKKEESGTETTNEEKVAADSDTDPAPSTRPTVRRGSTNSQTGQIPVQTGPRLVIDMIDGRRVEHFMSAIRRVTVENNQIVVRHKDGLVERTRMREVLRMAIEP